MKTIYLNQSIKEQFEKEGKGIQPKLSYVMLIPGTDELRERPRPKRPQAVQCPGGATGSKAVWKSGAC